jgi:hypothetical protein
LKDIADDIPYGGAVLKIVITFITLVVMSFSTTGVFAQTIEDRLKSLEETLKKQEQTIQTLRALQEILSKQEKTIREQQKVIEELRTEIKQTRSAPPSRGISTMQTGAARQMQQQVQELKDKVDQVAEAQTRTIPSIFNPAIGLVGETIFSYRDQGSDKTGSNRPGGFDAFQRSVELNLSGSVDPFARAYAVINASVDPITGEAMADVEEASIVTTSLPWNFTVQGGRFFGEFGRLSYIHDHELPFVNRPLVLDQYIGGESKTDGIQINYLLPIPHYISLTAGAGTQFGDTPNNIGDFRSFNGLNFWSRLSTYFDLTPNVSLEPGLSGLWNPQTMDRGGGISQSDGCTLTERERRLMGLDFVVSYKPLQNNQFKSLIWGTELLYSNNRYDVTSPDNSVFNRSVGSYGLYSYLAYKFHREWTAGFLFDWVENNHNDQFNTTAYSPFITWNLSHWGQLRLQYTYTNPSGNSGLSPDNAVYLQWAWIIGSHAHGWQQR